MFDISFKLSFTTFNTFSALISFASNFVLLGTTFVSAFNSIFVSSFFIVVFVLSSDFEGMPNSLMEAMAMGFPVISTDCPSGGPESLIENEENGLLVPVNDSNQLAVALYRLIEDESFKKELGEKAKDIRSRFNQSIISRKLVDFITNGEIKV